MGCRRILHSGPRSTEAAAACFSILLSVFLSGKLFITLSRAMSLLPGCDPQRTLGRPLSAPARLLHRGFGVGMGRLFPPLDQSVFLGFSWRTHSDSLCSGVTVRCLLERLTAWQRDTHPPQAHVQYRGPLGGSALRGYLGSQADNQHSCPLPPSSVCVCVYGRIAFSHLSRSGNDENVATTRLS